MEITEYLPVDFRTQMEAETLCGAEEIRLRVGQPLEILYADEKEKEIGLLTEAHMREVLNYLSGYSVYALEEELRQGYFTLEGGHRIGVSGRASYEKHGTSSCMKLLSCISGFRNQHGADILYIKQPFFKTFQSRQKIQPGYFKSIRHFRNRMY